MGVVMPAGTEGWLVTVTQLGYRAHVRAAGDRPRGFDLVALDMGQYDSFWDNIHMTPEQSTQAAIDLDKKALLPAHIGRFAITAHDWVEPLLRLAEVSKSQTYRLVAPAIGKIVDLVSMPEHPAQSWPLVPSTPE